MKKVLSLVLTFVMVAAAFAMLVPTASAAAGEIVLYENDFENPAYAGKTGSALLDAVFGQGGYAYYQTDNTKVGATIEETAMGGKALHINGNSNGSAMYFQLANDARVMSHGAVLEMEYIFNERATNTSSDHRMFGFAVNDVLTANNGNQVVGLIYNNFTSTNNSLRFGHWDKALTTTQGQAFYNLQGTRIKYRCEITATYTKLYAAEWNGAAYGDLQLIGEMNNTVDGDYETQYAAKNRHVAAIMLQNGNNVTIDNVKLTTVIGATFPEAPAVTTSAGSVLYTQDFSNAAYAGKTDAALADAIFGEGNHNVDAAGAVLSIVDGALKIDTSANKTSFQGILFENAVISEGYVAEMDYTFGNDFVNALTRDLNGRFLTFTTHTALGSNYDMTVVGPYSPGIDKDDLSVISGSPNARVANRPTSKSAGWQGWTSTYGTPDNVNTLDVTYRMRATVTKDTLKLEVAKYTDGVLGDYVEIATAAHNYTNETLGDVMSICAQNESSVTVDNITVTSLTSTPVNSFAGYQPGANQIRLVGLLDTVTFTNATAVGFEVAILGKGEFKNLECNYVYESIDSATAASLNAGYDYLYAMHITDIPAGEYSFRVVPYYVVDGNTVYGAAKDFVVNIANAQ